MICAHVYISGVVQGVFYRDWTRKNALELGLGGWVKNLFDGRVEAIFEGEEKKVREMIQRCHKGPPAALVEKVEVEWEEILPAPSPSGAGPAGRGEFKNFEINHG